jgi:integrase
MASPYEYRPGKWRVHMSVGGVRHNQTFDSKAEAELWIAERAVARHKGTPVKPEARKRGGPTVGEFYPGWAASRNNGVDLVEATRRRYEIHWKRYIEPRWGLARIGTITAHKIDDWVREMHNDDIGAQTIKGVVTYFLTILGGASKHFPNGKSPSKRDMKRLPPTPNPVKRSATDEELAAIFANAKGQYRIMWQLMGESALRWSECAGLQGWCLDLKDVDNAWVHVEPVCERDGTIRDFTKNKESRDVPISPEIALALREHMLGRDPLGTVFTDPDYGNDDGNLIYQKVLHREWRPTCAAAGVELHVHELRHTAVTTWLDHGVSPQTVCALAGWRDMRQLLRYAHKTKSAMDRARDAMIR